MSRISISFGLSLSVCNAHGRFSVVLRRKKGQRIRIKLYSISQAGIAGVPKTYFRFDCCHRLKMAVCLASLPSVLKSYPFNI